MIWHYDHLLLTCTTVTNHNHNHMMVMMHNTSDYKHVNITPIGFKIDSNMVEGCKLMGDVSNTSGALRLDGALLLIRLLTQ